MQHWDTGIYFYLETIKTTIDIEMLIKDVWLVLPDDSRSSKFPNVSNDGLIRAQQHYDETKNYPY